MLSAGAPATIGRCPSPACRDGAALALGVVRSAPTPTDAAAKPALVAPTPFRKSRRDGAVCCLSLLTAVPSLVSPNVFGRLRQRRTAPERMTRTASGPHRSYLGTISARPARSRAGPSQPSCQRPDTQIGRDAAIVPVQRYLRSSIGVVTGVTTPRRVVACPRATRRSLSRTAPATSPWLWCCAPWCIRWRAASSL